MKITKNGVKILDLDEVDRIKYFDFYIRPFTESLVLEFI